MDRAVIHMQFLVHCLLFLVFFIVVSKKVTKPVTFLMYLFDYKRSPSYLSGANPKISLASAGVATSLLSSFAI